MSHPRDQELKTNFAILITSDSRSLDNDETGKLAVKLIERAGHKVTLREIEPNDPERIRNWILNILTSGTSVIITSGGTGIGKVDITVDTVRKLFDKELPGFGEHFRRLSFEEVGVAGLMSRTVAGIIDKKVIFCLPGSRGAMRTALEKIILPGIGHMIWELERR
jgi:molybdopterin adenylyltransferase